MDMIIFLATMVIDYLLTALLVGFTFSAVCSHWIKKRFTKRYLLILFLSFALLDTYYRPAIFSLDATIEIGNEQIADYFNVKDPVKMGEFFAIDWIDPVIWILQSVIAYASGIGSYWRIYGQKNSCGCGSKK